MKKIQLISMLLFYVIIGFSQQADTSLIKIDTPKIQQPIIYFGRLEMAGIFQSNKIPIPAKFSYEVKYWLNKQPSFTKTIGFGYTKGSRFRYATNNEIFIEGLVQGQGLTYSYEYFSGRFKLQTKSKIISPYLELGTGLLVQSDKIIRYQPNPDYDPNHTCPEGSPKRLSNITDLKKQYRLGLDAATGISVGLSEKIRLVLGVNYLAASKVSYLEKQNIQNSLDEVGSHNQTVYNWKNRMSHSFGFKVGFSVRLFSNPNVIRTSTGNDNETDSLGGGGGGCK